MRFYLRIFSNRRYEGGCLYVGEYSRYTVFEVSNGKTFNKIAFKTNSRSKLKIWLDLNGLRILFNTRETWVSDRRQVFGFIAQSLRRPSSNTSEGLTTECISKIKIKLGQANGRNHDKRGKRRAERA